MKLAKALELSAMGFAWVPHSPGKIVIVEDFFGEASVHCAVTEIPLFTLPRWELPNLSDREDWLPVGSLRGRSMFSSTGKPDNMSDELFAEIIAGHGRSRSAPPA